MRQLGEACKWVADFISLTHITKYYKLIILDFSMKKEVIKKFISSNGWFRLRKLYYFGALGLLSATSSFAQLSSVNGELEQVTSDLKDTSAKVISIVQVLAGILSVVALITLVVKFQEGDHEAKKKLMMWLGGLVVFFIAISIVKSLFTL